MNRGLILSALLTASLSLGCQTAHNACTSCPGGDAGVYGPGGGAAMYEAPSDPQGAMLNYLPNYGHGGPFAELHGKRFRGPQSHNGPAPGPAMGPSSPTVTYPYYTTRGPRDYLNPNPPSIGR